MDPYTLLRPAIGHPAGAVLLGEVTKGGAVVLLCNGRRERVPAEQVELFRAPTIEEKARDEGHTSARAEEYQEAGS